MVPYKIIFEQIGGRRFRAMTGAYNFLHNGDNELQFRFRGSRKLNWCKIGLNALDLYDVEFCQIGSAPKFIVRNRVRHENVYASGLQRLFTEVTGLDTHL